jgi:PAS domain S-box-containing protein
LKNDMDERKHREEQLRSFLSEARQKQSETQSLLDEYRSILECETFEEAARRVFHACCKATGAVSGYVALRKPDSDENEVLFLEAGGMSCSVNPELPMPIRGLRAEAYEKAAVVYENDFMQSKWLQFMPPGHVEMRNVMFIPLIVSGKVIGVIGLANKPTDFTEDDARITAPFGDTAAVSLRRAKDKEALRKSEEKYRQLAESTDAILWEFDILADRWTYVSPQAEKILGFAPEEWTNLQFWRDHLHPEDRDWASKYCAECTERGESHVFEYRFLNKDGGITWLRDVISVEMQDSRPVKLRGFMIDITDRKKVEDDLHESKRKFQASEEKYRILVNNTPDFIFSLDRESRYTAVNQSVCRSLGLEAHEIIGKNQRELGFPETLILEWDKLHHKVFNTGQVVETETTTPMPDGTTRTYEVVMMPIFDEKGIATGIRVMSRDISYRKKMEEEIFKADKLESIGMLAGGIAHDFNNYLATLLGSISLAKLYKNDPKKIIEKLDIIEKASLRAKDLSNQLFAFATGGAPVKKKVYLNSSIVDNVKFALSGSNIRCNFFIEQGLHMVEIDEGQFNQVLNNILINAVQAMPEGGIIKIAAENVTVETEKNDYVMPLPEGTYVKISITDEGIGIPEKYLLKIFDPFLQQNIKEAAWGLQLPIP